MSMSCRSIRGTRGGVSASPMRSSTAQGQALARRPCARVAASADGADPSPPPARRAILGAGAAAAARLLWTPAARLGVPLSLWTLQPLSARAGTGVGGPRFASPEVQKELDRVLKSVVTKGKAAAGLRLSFHDAGTFSAATKDGGVNASIQYEFDRPESFGLKRGWRLVTTAEDQLKGTVAEGVSRADLVALVGARAVALCGGPVIPVPIGRVDARVADPANRMPGENLSAADLKANFAAKGITVREMVALSGAHTIGGKGFGQADVFDNAYYTSLLARPWLDKDNKMASMIGLPSDHVLPDDEECLPIIQEYANDQAAFFEAFSAAYVKMCGLGVTWA
nr:L-ascorbate peroxidase [Chlamydomonas sp. UWO 241]